MSRQSKVLAEDIIKIIMDKGLGTSVASGRLKMIDGAAMVLFAVGGDSTMPGHTSQLQLRI